MADELLGSDLPPAYNTQTGDYIPSDQLSQHLAKGTAGFRPGAMVPMFAPDGSRYDVPSETAIDTLNNGEGWQLASPEAERARRLQEASEEHPILAGIAAGASEAADVASFGQTAAFRAGTSKLSKAAGLGEGNFASDIEQIKKANPIATTVGTIGGALLGGAEGAGGKVLGAAAEGLGLSRLGGILAEGAAGETGLLSRAGASAVKYGGMGAAETGAYGAGMETARQISGLGNQDIAVEKILMEGAKGAGIGGILGGVLGGAGRLGGDALSQATKNMSREAFTIKALGGTTADAVKFIKTRPPEQRAAIVSTLLEEPGLVKPFTKLEDVAERLEAARERTGKEIGVFLKKVDEIPWYKPDKAKMLKEVDELIGELRSKNVGPDVALAKELERKWRPGLATANTAEEIQQFRIRFDQHKSAMWKTGQDTAKDASYRRFRDIVESNLENDVNQAVIKAGELGETGLVNDYLKLKQKQQAFIVADEIAKNAVAGQQAGRGGVGLGDVVRGGAGFLGATAQGLSGLPAFGIGLATDAAWRFAKGRHAAAILARSAEKLRTGIDASTMRLSNTVTQTLGAGAKTLIQGVPPAAGKVLQRFGESSEVARQARANPPVAAAKIERAVAPLGELDPTLAGKTAIKLQGDLSWLTSKLPPPGTNSVFSTKGLPGGKKGKGGKGKKAETMTTSVSVGGNATNARISITAASKFSRYERALDRPLEAIGDIKDGKVAAETVEMLRDRRPFIREQIQNEMANKLAEMSGRGKTPGRTARVQLSLIAGAPLDSTMEPAFIKSVQAHWAKERETAGQPPQTPPKRETSSRIRDRARSRLSAGDGAGEDTEIG